MKFFVKWQPNIQPIQNFNNIIIKILKDKYVFRCPCSILANLLDSDIRVNKFKVKLQNYVLFWTNTHLKKYYPSYVRELLVSTLRLFHKGILSIKKERVLIIPQISWTEASP